jgi:hypothetical protein
VNTEVTHELGPGAGAEYTDLAVDQSGLVLYLNSINLTITASRDPQGDRLLMAFCRDLAGAATIVADELNLKLHPRPRLRKPQDESPSHDH